MTACGRERAERGESDDCKRDRVTAVVHNSLPGLRRFASNRYAIWNCEPVSAGLRLFGERRRISDSRRARDGVTCQRGGDRGHVNEVAADVRRLLGG